MINDRNHLRLCKSKRQPPWKKPKVDTAVLVCLVVIPRDTVYKGLFFTTKCEQCHWKCRWKIKEHAEDLQLAHSSLKDIQGEDLLVSAKSSMATFANESVPQQKASPGHPWRWTQPEHKWVELEEDLRKHLWHIDSANLFGRKCEPSCHHLVALESSTNMGIKTVKSPPHQAVI